MAIRPAKRGHGAAAGEGGLLPGLDASSLVAAAAAADDGLSKADFRWRLLESLRAQGVEDRLKTQMRSYIITELRRRSDQHGAAATAAAALRRQESVGGIPPLMQKVVDTMIVDYLKARGNDFTLSVFLPESGMNQPGQSQSSNENHGPTILKILEALVSPMQIERRDCEMQTEMDDEALVDLQIRRSDKDFARQYNAKQELSQAVEQRLRAYKADLDTRLRAEMEEQLASFKEIELSKMRMEEHQRYTAETARLKAEHDLKLLALQQSNAQEQDAVRKAAEQRERDREAADLTAHRKITDDSHRAVVREAQLRAEAEVLLRAADIEKAALAHRLQDTMRQVADLQEFRDSYAVRLQEAVADYKISLNQEHAAILSAAEVERAKVQAERTVLQEKSQMVEQMLQQAKGGREETESLRSLLRLAESQLRDAQKERDDALLSVKELRLQATAGASSTALEFELQSLKMQLVEAEKAGAKRQEEYQALLADMMNPRNELQKEVQKLRKSEAKWKRECQDLVVKLDLELSRGERLEHRLEEEVLKNKELKRELSDARQARMQTKTAPAPRLTPSLRIRDTSGDSSRRFSGTPSRSFASIPDPLDFADLSLDKYAGRQKAVEPLRLNQTRKDARNTAPTVAKAQSWRPELDKALEAAWHEGVSSVENSAQPSWLPEADVGRKVAPMSADGRQQPNLPAFARTTPRPVEDTRRRTQEAEALLRENLQALDDRGASPNDGALWDGFGSGDRGGVVAADKNETGALQAASRQSQPQTAGEKGGIVRAVLEPEE
ncbi:oxidative DNA demethylase, partial [Cladochytrium tenue]